MGLCEAHTRMIDRHVREAGMREKKRVRQWDGAHSVYDPRTGRIYVYKDNLRKSAYQGWVFESKDGVCNALTAKHNVKFWDLRRAATPRELARIQGFPDSFTLPERSVVALFGRSVSVPVVEHVLRCVSDGESTPPRTFVDVCAGVGGFAVAVRNVLEARCVGFSEIEPAAIATYRANFPAAPPLGDMHSAVWPRCDLVCMGFPCQPFSRSMQTLRREDHPDRFACHALPAILDATQATHVVLENVRSLLTFGRPQLDFIVSELERRGFSVAWSVLDARDFGLPQTRKRLFVVARKGSKPRPVSESVTPVHATLRDIMDQ